MNNFKARVSGSRGLVLACGALALSGCFDVDHGSQVYAVSGSISGLSSDGLVLTVNNAPVTVATDAATVALLTGPSGTAYSVTVGTQPKQQTCTVANGSGTIASANITNVMVTCVNRTYALGGAISGLTNSGLVLANGVDTLTVSANESGFQMPHAVALGTAYNVTVMTQPAGETCTVTNGSGAMPAGAVSNVSIACSVNTYSIGGTISGLTGSGLVLLNSGGDATSIAVNATQFTMPARVAYGGSYAITVKTRPGGQTCGIRQGSGSSVTADVANISITCANVLVYSFGDSGSQDGSLPEAGLVQGRDGAFYGTTYQGGTLGKGTVFKVTSAGSVSVLHSFTHIPDGAFPQSTLIQGRNGDFYGTTDMGGPSGFGTVFRIDAAGNESVVYSFAGNSAEGGGLEGPLIEDEYGNLYGTASYGGTNLKGTVFKIDTAGILTVLHTFDGLTGNAPLGGLILDNSGNLYGTTSAGGAFGGGVLFKLPPAGAPVVLHNFGDVDSHGNADGGVPQATLIQGDDGNFYGTTYFGGANNKGTVFKFSPTEGETVLHSFGGSGDGTNPNGALIQGIDKNFYGTTTGGGVGEGTVFKVTPSGEESLLYYFSISDGAEPYGSLVQVADGSLYGTTYGGGTNGRGAVFRIFP